MALRTFSLLMFVVLLGYVPSTNEGEVKLGLLIPFKRTNRLGNYYHRGEFYASAMKIAVDNVNQRPDLLAGQNLTFIWNDTDCEEFKTLQSVVYQLNQGVSAFIGPGCTCNTSARIAASFNKTMISYMCSNPEVSYKQLYPTFIRTFAIDTKLTPSLLSLLKYFNWKRVAIIYENVTKWIEMKNNVVKRLRTKGITVALELLTHASALYRPENHTDNYRNTLRKIKQEARIVVFVSDFYIAREGMLHAYDEDMINGDYVFIIFELDQTQVTINTKHPFKWFFSSYSQTLNRYHHVKAAFEAAFVLAIRSPALESYKKFTDELKRRSPEAPFNSTVYKGTLWHKNSGFPANKTKPPIYGAYLYDAVYQYAIAVNKTLAQKQPLTGQNIAEKMLDIQYDSILGYKIHFDKNGDAEFNLTLLDMQPMANKKDQHEMIPVGDFHIMYDNKTNEGGQVFIRRPNLTIKWPGGRTGPPRDSPECGFHGELCIKPTGEVRPVITSRSLSEVVVDEGNVLYLKCEAEGAPTPMVIWRKNEHLIQNRTIETNYIRENVSGAFGGVYECEATNSVGSDRYMVVVKIMKEPTKRRPSKDGLEDGAIAGIVIGVLVFLVLLVIFAIWCRKSVCDREKRANKANDLNGTVAEKKCLSKEGGAMRWNKSVEIPLMDLPALN